MKLHLDTSFYPSRLLPVILVATLSMASFSCKEDPVTVTPITESNLFPYLPGRSTTFTTTVLDTLNQQKGNSFKSVLFVNGVLTLGGKAALQVIDSVYTDTTGVSYVDTLFFSTENGDLHQRNVIGLRPFKRVSTAWQVWFNKTAGLAGEYTIIDPAPDSAKITGQVFAKEDLVLGTTTVQAYRLEVKVSKATGYNATYTLYFSDGKGIVKIIVPVQNYGTARKSEGYTRTWQRQNFAG